VLGDRSVAAMLLCSALAGCLQAGLAPRTGEIRSQKAAVSLALPITGMVPTEFGAGSDVSGNSAGYGGIAPFLDAQGAVGLAFAERAEFAVALALTEVAVGGRWGLQSEADGAPASMAIGGELTLNPASPTHRGGRGLGGRVRIDWSRRSSDPVPWLVLANAGVSYGPRTYAAWDGEFSGSRATRLETRVEGVLGAGFGQGLSLLVSGYRTIDRGRPFDSSDAFENDWGVVLSLGFVKDGATTTR